MIRILLVTAIVSLLATACATVKGVGKDIKSVGEAGQAAIDSAKKKK